MEKDKKIVKNVTKVKNDTNITSYKCESGKEVTSKIDLNYLKAPETNKNIGAKLGTTLRAIRKRYGLTTYELAEMVGATYRTIENYENNRTDKPDFIILAKIVQVFNNIPAKDGNYYHYSVDAITGLTPFSSVDNELIHNQLGLENEAIEHLKAIYQDDKQRIIENTKSLGIFDTSIPVVPKNIRSFIISYFLSSSKLESLCDSFRELTQKDLYTKLLSKNGDEFNDVPFNEVYLSTNNNIASKIEFTPETIKALNKTVIENIFNELVNEFDHYQHRDLEKILKPLLEKGYSMDEILNCISEMPGTKSTIKKLIQNEIDKLDE